MREKRGVKEEEPGRRQSVACDISGSTMGAYGEISKFGDRRASFRVRELIPNILLIHRQISVGATRKPCELSYVARQRPTGNGRQAPGDSHCETTKIRKDRRPETA